MPHVDKRILFTRTLHNLIDNAIKYTPAGGSVAVELSQQDGHICCTVKDTGIGIPQEHQAHVFERFYRVDKSHSHQTGILAWDWPSSNMWQRCIRHS